MKIIPWAGKIQLKIDEPSVGILDTSNMPTAIECGEVIAIGEGINSIKVGDKLFFKSWAVDIITYDQERYYFIDIDTNGICGIVK